jgi:hypothetical protein
MRRLRKKIGFALVCAIFTCGAMAQRAEPSPGVPAEGRRVQRERQDAWFRRGRKAAGQSAAALRQRAFLQKMRMRATRQSTAPLQRSPNQISGSAWSSLGPAPLASDASGDGQQDYNWVSGRATAAVIDPADATGNTVYAGGAYGGVWKSTNAAAQDPATVAWTPLIDDQATLAVGAIAVQPQLTNPNPSNTVILVGTGEATSSSDSYYGLGILRSANAGASWTLISADSTGSRSFAGMSFSKIAFSTSSPSLVVAATAGSWEGLVEGISNPLTANLGIYDSTDGGNTWSYANVQDSGVATSPGSVTSVAYNAVAGEFFAALRYHGFYSSSDGINWTRLSTQPGSGLTVGACPAQSASSSCSIYRGEISVVPGRNEMYVWYVDVNDVDQGIWESTNGGATWTQINDAGVTNCGDDSGCGTEDGTYNLELAAVPDGEATDLYAAAINLYKCQITIASPACAGTASNTFLNLTHVYGCSSIAKVHPAQHAVSFLLLNNNTQDLMVFSNDGGIYRALDGYSGLDSGSCGSSNQFDSLNQTIGSMTQFVSFAQASSDPNTMLGGTQGNGAPASQSALASSSWLNVDAGDIGYTAINPSNENEWFVSSPPVAGSGVNIFRCTSGVNCHTQDFQNDHVVSGETLGGDAGAYYPPFILDPQDSGEMLVGTCRLWRGTSTGSGFTALSNSFETGGAGICTGDEINLVDAIAAGGPTDSNGFSNVLYAATNGFGPLMPTVPSGGHLWANTNVASAATWIDQTGSINPEAFPISSVAIDTSDATGLTAYATIMGFYVSHVWKTTDGGTSWTDYTGNLPDSPVNAVLVDPGSNSATSTVYVATDVGVFSSYGASPSWTEVGPAPGIGESGFLPNVAVTALQMFNTGNDKFLRASTYGRGLWQFPLVTTPDFALSISNTPLTMFAGSPAILNGLAFALDGYSNAVTLACEAGATAPPSTCMATPSSITPTTNGAAFSIEANGADGAYEFDITGTDTNALTHTVGVTLNVIDFGLTTPSLSKVTLGPATSPAISFQVTASGPFAQSVSLSCTGLPTGATCNFQPSTSVNPIASTPVSITLTIASAPNTPQGTFSVQIVGTTANGPSKTQPISLIVIGGYSLAIANPTLTAYENAVATFTGTVTSLNGYNSKVNLSCGSGAPPTCSVAPAQLTPTATGAAFTVTVSSGQCGEYSFNIVAAGTDPYAVSHSAAVGFTSTSIAPPDYTLEIANPSLTAPVNNNATFNGTLMATACYSGTVNLSCGSGAPANCAASPVSVKPSVAGSAFTVVVSSGKVATYNFSIVALGNDPSGIQHTSLVTFSTTASTGFSYSLSSNPTSESVKAGETATYQIQVAPSAGTFPSPVELSFTGCPPLSTCALSQTSIGTGKGATTLTLSIQTTSAVVASTRSRSRFSTLCVLWLLFPGLVFLGRVKRSAINPRRSSTALLSLFAVVVALGLINACGGGLQGGNSASTEPGTPTGSYTLTVTAAMNSAAGSPTKTIDLTLSVN